MRRSMSHVLIISFGYEPLGHVSATRSTYMGPALTDLGWDVSVLTVDWSFPLPEKIASVEESVRRALAEPSPRRVAIDGRLIDPAFVPSSDHPTTERPAPRATFLRKLQTLRNTLSAGPYAGWAHRAYAAATLLHRERPIDAVWAIHGDISCHAIAYWLWKRQGIPWIADFKDAWNKYHSEWGQPVQRFAMKRRLRTAASLTETCSAQATSDAREFGRPAHVIYSGYDEALMDAAAPKRPAEGFGVTYMGSFGISHDLSLLPGVFSALLRRGELEASGLTLHQYAPVPQFQALLDPVGCGHIVRSHGRVPRSEAYSIMRGSDVLLLLPMTNTDFQHVGLKEMEYVASGTPVLVLGEPLEEFAPIMREAPHVTIIRDAEEGAAFLEEHAQAFRAGRPSPTRTEANGSWVKEFTWRVQSRRLSQVLESGLRGERCAMRADTTQ